LCNSKLVWFHDKLCAPWFVKLYLAVFIIEKQSKDCGRFGCLLFKSLKLLTMFTRQYFVCVSYWDIDTLIDAEDAIYYQSSSIPSIHQIGFNQILNAVSNYFKENNMLWSNCISVFFLTNFTSSISNKTTPTTAATRTRGRWESQLHLKILRGGINHNGPWLTATPKNIYKTHCFPVQRRKYQVVLCFCIRIAYLMCHVTYGNFKKIKW